MIYKCNFVDEDNGYWSEISAYDASSAAERYVEENLTDSYRTTYDGGYAVLVINEDNLCRIFNVFVKRTSGFYAKEIKLPLII
jgi:hypothetical protein